jgi:5-enolpyruvylshikimate-3-phosphate synthase
MTFAIASLASQGPITISGLDCIATSYPGFFADFNQLKQN